MNLDESKLIELSQISEMHDDERNWLRNMLRVKSGYFEVETGKFVVLVFL